MTKTLNALLVLVTSLKIKGFENYVNKNKEQH